MTTNGIFTAPFWSDVDTGDENFDLGVVRYAVNRKPATLNRARDQIRSVFSNEKSFTPSYLIVATWEEVGYYARVLNEVRRDTLVSKQIQRV